MDETIPNNPPLPAASIQDAKDMGHPLPGAGGWVPSQATVVAIGAVSITFGAMAPVFPPLVGGPLGVALGAACGAIAGGCAYFAAKSAGPRSVQ